MYKDKFLVTRLWLEICIQRACHRDIAARVSTTMWPCYETFGLWFRSIEGTHLSQDSHTNSTSSCSPLRQYLSQISQVRLMYAAIPVMICLCTPTSIISITIFPAEDGTSSYHQPWPSKKIPQGKPISRRQRLRTGQNTLSKFQIKNPRPIAPSPKATNFHILLRILASRRSIRVRSVSSK